MPETTASYCSCAEIDQKVAGVVGHLQSGTSIPASAVYAKCDIPHHGVCVNPDLTKPGHKTTFRLIANDNALGAALALFDADHLKIKTVAIIDDRTAYGQGVASVLKLQRYKRRQGCR